MIYNLGFAADGARGGEYDICTSKCAHMLYVRCAFSSSVCA